MNYLIIREYLILFFILLNIIKIIEKKKCDEFVFQFSMACGVNDLLF